MFGRNFWIFHKPVLKPDDSRIRGERTGEIRFAPGNGCHQLAAHFPAIVAQTGGVVLVSVVSVIYAPLLEASFDVLTLLEMGLAVVAAYSAVQRNCTSPQ
jgi:hypothetical protein